MVKVYRYYQIASFEDSYRVCIDTVSQNNRTKLRALSYRVAVIVIVSKGKAVENNDYKSDCNTNRYQRNSCSLSNK